MMRRVRPELKRSIKEQARLRERGVQAFTARLNRFLEKEIPRVARLPDAAAGQFPEALNAASVLGGLQTGLEEAGLKSVVRGIRQTYADELSSLATRFSLTGIDNAFSSADRATVEALISNDLDRVSKLISPYIDDVSSTMLRAVIGGQVPDISALLGDTTDVLESQLTTELNTMLNGFSRTVTAYKANELGLELFIYIGPEDKLTRDFCSDVLSKDPPIYTREEIAALDNEQGLDAMIYGGGYNCRHQWAAISEEEAIASGWSRNGD
jgi:hypothetical protein